MSNFKLPLHESVDIKPGCQLSDEELLVLFRPLANRINEMDSKEAFVVGFATRIDSQSKEYVQMVEMEPAYEIRPYFKAKTSRYKGL